MLSSEWDKSPPTGSSPAEPPVDNKKTPRAEALERLFHAALTYTSDYAKVPAGRLTWIEKELRDAVAAVEQAAPEGWATPALEDAARHADCCVDRQDLAQAQAAIRDVAGLIKGSHSRLLCNPKSACAVCQWFALPAVKTALGEETS